MTSATDFHDSTLWEITPSFKYDVLTLLNVLTGDPFYTSYYPEEHKRFEPGLTPDVAWPRRGRRFYIEGVC